MIVLAGTDIPITWDQLSTNLIVKSGGVEYAYPSNYSFAIDNGQLLISVGDVEVDSININMIDSIVMGVVNEYCIKGHIKYHYGPTCVSKDNSITFEWKEPEYGNGQS